MATYTPSCGDADLKSIVQPNLHICQRVQACTLAERNYENVHDFVFYNI